MRLGRNHLLVLATAAVLLAAAVLWWALRDRTPPVPPHPLSAVPAASVVAVSAGTEPLAKGSAAFTKAAALPSRLVPLPPRDAMPINWAAAQTLRLATAAGLVVWLQIAEQPDATWVRVNADSVPSADLKVKRQAAAIKRLRLKAFRLGRPDVRPAASSSHG